MGGSVNIGCRVLGVKRKSWPSDVIIVDRFLKEVGGLDASTKRKIWKLASLVIDRK